jgi:hypothetical protein
MLRSSPLVQDPSSEFGPEVDTDQRGIQIEQL